MVLHRGANDERLPVRPDGTRELVYRVGGAASKDDGMAIEVSPDKIGHSLPASVVAIRGDERLGACASMNGTLPFQESQDTFGNVRERRSSGGIVEVYVCTCAAAKDGHLRIQADDPLSDARAEVPHALLCRVLGLHTRRRTLDPL